MGIETMFRIYSGIDQSAHLQRVQVWFEITDRFCVEVSRNSIFLQDYKLQGRSYIWGNRGGRLGCFLNSCLSENNYFVSITLNVKYEAHDYIAETRNGNCNRLSSFFKRRCSYALV